MADFVPVDYDPFDPLSRPVTPQSLAQNIVPNSNDLAAHPVSFAQWLDAAKKYGGNVLENTKDLLSLPGDVYAGRVDPMSDDGIDRAIGLASMTGPGPLLSRGGGLRAGFGGAVPEHLQHMSTNDLLDQAWVVGGAHGQMETDPMHMAAALKAINPDSKMYALQAIDGLDMTLKEKNALADMVVKQWDNLPAAHVIHGPALHALEQLPEGDLYTNWGPKIAQKMLAYGEDDPMKAVPLAASEYGNTAKLTEAAKVMKNGVTPDEPQLIPPSAKSVPWVAPAKPVPRDLEELIKPLDWSSVAAGVPPLKSYPDSIAERFARAEDQGYNTTVPLYKGMSTDLRDRYTEAPSNSLWDPVTKPNERAIFASDNPHIANYYADPSNEAHIIPMFARANNAFEVNWPDINAGDLGYSGHTMQRVIDHARDRGGDMLVIKNIHDLGGGQTQYAVLRPEVLRSWFAKFDPERVGDNDLLATRGLGPGMALVPVDHDPFDGEGK